MDQPLSFPDFKVFNTIRWCILPNMSVMPVLSIFVLAQFSHYIHITDDYILKCITPHPYNIVAFIHIKVIWYNVIFDFVAKS